MIPKNLNYRSNTDMRFDAIHASVDNPYIDKIKDSTDVAKIVQYEEHMLNSINTSNSKSIKECLEYTKMLKSKIKHGESKIMQSTNEKFEHLFESSPPSGPARRFTEDPNVKKSFRERYGKRWKEVMYATAWKKYKNQESVGTPSQLEIGTGSLVNIYRKATPGQN